MALVPDPNAGTTYDPNNLLQPPQAKIVTPPGARTYPTNEEVARMYQMANALRADKMPVRSPWQGVSNMLGDIEAGYLFGNAQRAGRIPQAAAQQELKVPPTPTTQNTSDNSENAPSSKKTASREGASTDEPKGGSDLMSRAEAATSKQESGGKYGEIGPTHPKYGRALGKYQIMEANIGPWSQKYIGRTVTPDEFLRSPDIQDSIYRGQMADYINKYGVEGAGRAWLGGPGGVNNPQRRDALGTSVGDYGRKFASMVGPQGGPTQVASLDPSIVGGAVPQKPPVSAPTPPGPVLAAGRGAAAPAATAGGQPAAPGPFSTVVPIPPGILPPPTNYSQQDIKNIILNPAIPQEFKAWAIQNYMSTQVNPRSVPIMGGNITVPAGQPPGNQRGYVIPNMQTITESAKGVSTQPSLYFDPISGTIKYIPIEGGVPAGGGTPTGPAPPTIGPNSVQPSVPTPAPAVPQAPAVSPGPTPTMPRAPALPPAPAPATAPAVPPAPTPAVPPAPATAPAVPPAPTSLPPNVGALPPTNQVASTAPIIPQALPPPAPGVAEKSADVLSKAQVPALPGAAPPVSASDPMGLRVAQALGGPAGSIGPGGTQTADISPRLRELGDYGLDLERRQELNKQDVDQFVKNVELYTDTGNRAAKAIPNLEMAAKMVGDPRYYSGPGADFVKVWNQIKSKFGNDPAAAAPMEIFDKIMSGTAVAELKVQLQGLGQVRVAEINLINNSLANRYNTQAANLAVLDIMKRVYTQTDMAGKIASAYQQGWRWDASGKPYFAGGEAPTNAGLQQTLNQFYRNNPLFSDKDIENYNNTFRIAVQQGKAVRQDKFTPLTTDDVGVKSIGGAPKGGTEAAPPGPKGPAGSDPLGFK